MCHDNRIMPLQVSNHEFEELLHVLANFPSGASVQELLETSQTSFTKRTLQRRLEQLIEDRRIEPRGEARARRYHLKMNRDINYRDITEESGFVLREDPVSYDWLSKEAQEIREIIKRPLARRNPVGYQATFLEDYIPNQSFYLPEKLRRELEQIGQVGVIDLPAGTYLRQVMDRLLIDLSWNSSRLEGNTYSLLETQRLLELGEGADGRGIEETQMILNHKLAIEMLADQATEIGFNRYTVCNLHALLSDNLLADLSAGGRVRSRPVGISGTVFHPLEVPQKLELYFDQILQKAEAIQNPFEQAFFAMVQLPYLQPFEDVNKRVSRLAANIPFVRHNLCPLSFVDVSPDDYVNGLLGVYELNRVEYFRDVFVWAYRRSCARYAAIRQSLGEPDPFRLQNRAMIGQFVREVVQNKMTKSAATKWIAKEAAREIAQADRVRFTQVVEAELISLHEGNIARYRLRPAEYHVWKATWQ